jgi:hypothetical protein
MAPYAARPPVTATLDAVDVMSTGIDRSIPATKANPFESVGCLWLSPRQLLSYAH